MIQNIIDELKTMRDELVDYIADDDEVTGFDIHTHLQINALASAMDALKRNIPVAPIGYNNSDKWVCGNCDWEVYPIEKFCPECGVKLGWKEVK